jgi:hypothetical protein
MLADRARRRAQNPLAGLLFLGTGFEDGHMTIIIFLTKALSSAI